ncbi:MAG: hypothetical protein KatS3mg117_3246 [Geminicoccaceae bacterium]|nr:MAG: hypothetical protein KatS3mg117_3246 [Geminicoccaceae bacterium]
MELLHLIPSYLPAVRYGGPVRSVHGLARELVRLGHRVRVLTTDIDGPGRLEVPTDRWVELDGVEVRYCPVGRPRRITRAPAMRAELERLLPEVDLVHLHAVWQWPTWFGARAAFRANVPYILSPRGMLVEELIARKSPLAKKVWLALIERRTLARATAIHVTSAREGEAIRALGLDLAPLVEVPNGVDLPDPLPSEQEAERAWAPHPRGRRLLFLGRISWEKGIDRVIRALVDVPYALLRNVGNDERDTTSGLEALAREVGVADRVEFVGPAHGAEKWALLAGADLLVLPSPSENWGIVVSEALGVGTPVVAGAGVGAAELVRRHELGAVVEGSPASLAAAIRELLAAPERRRAMGERAKGVIGQNFSHAAVARAMVDVYAQLLAEKRRHASVPVSAAAALD